jgi:TrmH family RNA methyltransferase
LQSGAPIQKIFYAPVLLAHNDAALALVTQGAAAGVPLLSCAPEVIHTLTETVTPQGIAAVVALPHLPLPQPLTLTLILDGVRDPGNAGTLLRTAEAAGVNAVFFGPETVDPFNDKVLRAGMGAHFRLPLRSCDNWAAIQQTLTPSPTFYVAQAGAQHVYTAIDWRQPSALIVGGEAAGPSAAAATFAQSIAIPMQHGVESLNAAVAGAVILFEAARQRRYAEGN